MHAVPRRGRASRATSPGSRWPPPAPEGTPSAWHRCSRCSSRAATARGVRANLAARTPSAGAALAKALAWVLEPYGLLAVGGAILLAGAALSLRAPKREGTPRTRRAQPGVVKVVARLSARPFVAQSREDLEGASALYQRSIEICRANPEGCQADAVFSRRLVSSLGVIQAIVGCRPCEPLRKIDA